MFRKLFSSFKKESVQPQAMDLSFGYHRYTEFVSFLQQNKYQQLEDAYEELTWDAKTLLNEGIGLNELLAADITRWVKQCPDSYIANLFAGVSKTRLAWIARTAAQANNVSEEAANKFFVLLEEAAAFLHTADEINPEDPEIAARIIRVYMGLGVEEETVTSYFDSAVSFQPDHLMAHLMMINYLAPKWRGSIEAMHAFADNRIQETGSQLLVTLKLFAITEEWLYYSMNGEDSRHSSFFSDAAIQEKIKTLYSNYREETEGALLIPYVYNYFAFLFWKIGDKEKAREIIGKIPGKMTVYPWSYIGVHSNDVLQKL
ncbi:MAG TPA: DUF4034 domain-containing protein [Ferruginibacter sp.]|nr:DUF4034 domain-containing protein [Ferruginibacter sp.]HPH92651.1 DUF4034 domain-containing protein [Ferruginibacter sp.]